VLVVDDDPISGAIVVAQLASIGIRAAAVASADEALLELTRGTCAAVLSDVQMPGRDGFALARQIRADEAAAGAPRIPIVALTAGTGAGERALAHAAGMDDLLTKPCLPADIAAALHRLVPALAALARPGIDDAVLARLAGGNAALAGEILADYLAAAWADLAALDAHARDGELGDLRRTAHRMKGSAGLVGAMRVQRRGGGRARGGARAARPALSTA
jgi:CheY-like chemotaxis protein/HPt (histidine-containing phosphotransfer) domain-containing protein